MRGDPTRTLLVVSALPHPWALLRDRLDPELVTVAWARPGKGPPAAAPWMVAGAGLEAPHALAPLRGRLVACRWVGPAPPGLPARPILCPDWRAVAAEVERALAVRLGGLRLAPGRGLVLPGGAYLTRAGDLETLLAAHPGGLDLAADLSGAQRARLRAAARRSNGLLDRHRLPLRVTCSGARVALAAALPAGDVGAS